MFEKHSREKFEAQENKVAQAEDEFKKSGGTSSIDESLEKYHYPGQPEGSLLSEIRLQRAKNKLEKLKEAGHKEALELNKRYEALRRGVEDANLKLTKFEQEELGMSEGETK